MADKLEYYDEDLLLILRIMIIRIQVSISINRRDKQVLIKPIFLQISLDPLLPGIVYYNKTKSIQIEQ